MDEEPSHRGAEGFQDINLGNPAAGTADVEDKERPQRKADQKTKAKGDEEDRSHAGELTGEKMQNEPGEPDSEE